jgi:hypothetical protein
LRLISPPRLQVNVLMSGKFALEGINEDFDRLREAGEYRRITAKNTRAAIRAMSHHMLRRLDLGESEATHLFGSQGMARCASSLPGRFHPLSSR